MIQPRFVLKAQDELALEAITAYREACRVNELHDQAAEVDKAIQEFVEWRVANPEAMKMPDHKHIPAGEA